MSYRKYLGALLLVQSLTPLHAEVEAFESGPFEAGLWEVSVSYELIGVEHQKFHPYTLQKCLTESDPVPPIGREGHDCRSTPEGFVGERFNWLLDCSNDWELIHGLGRAYFSGESLEGNVWMQVLSSNNPPQPMIFTFTGKRIGDCPVD